MPTRSTGPDELLLNPSSHWSYVGKPSSGSTGFGWIRTTGTPSVVCTSVWFIRTHKVSATLEVGGVLGVSDGVEVGVGVSAGVVLTDTSGGTLGAVSPPGPPHPASNAVLPSRATTNRVRMVTEPNRKPYSWLSMNSFVLAIANPHP
ncbi:hypothetical protein GCM10022235_49000 [Kribbella ginsengisoli]|uniref:Uncharacterized protein n=1 Tax=Kribbella ginsengisoli TaxID=363865 RepID=A0ABP6XY44_9ACTN